MKPQRSGMHTPAPFCYHMRFNTLSTAYIVWALIL